MMRLNSLSPDPGSRVPKKKRLGRGIGSGLGKTCGRGHKGQKARAGGFHKIGFEGGQMPIQRRLPKTGFNSRIAKTVAQIYLSELNRLTGQVIDLDVLREAGIISQVIKSAKVIQAGELTAAIQLKGIRVTKGARSVIEALGGSIED